MPMFNRETSGGGGTNDLITFDDADTIPALFEERVRRTPDRAAYRQFEPADNGWIAYSWKDMADRIARWRGGFVASGLEPGDRVAILLKNSVEWVCFDQAAFSLGLVSVPLHATDGTHNWADQLADAGARLLLVGQFEHWRRLAPNRGKFPALTRIICLEPMTEVSLDAVPVESWLETEGVETGAIVGPDTLATITYTSGTTGRPKGVMLSHRNILSALSATAQRHPGYLEDVFLSFLPMAHIFERTTEYYLAIACGGVIAFARSIPDLPKDLATVRPTIVMGVPRVFERVWKGVVKSASTSPLGARLLSRAVGNDLYKSKGTLIGGVERWLIKLFITRSLLNRFGGRLRLTICGGAPLSAELEGALRSVGLPLVVGYGLAEAAGPVSGDSLTEYEPGTVGRPLPGIEVRIADSDEILIRSASVMSGYWKRPEETANAVDQEGWLHTSDIGELRNGRLVVHGRMQDLIVLSTGEKFAPSDIEGQITTDQLFEQALVIGDQRPIVVALVILDRKHWQIFAQEKGLEASDPNNFHGKMALLERIGHLCRTFPDYAQVRDLYASFDPWTVEAGLLSVTLKVKRGAISARFADQIEDLFWGHR